MITAHDLARHLDAQRRAHADARMFAFQRPAGVSLEDAARVALEGDVSCRVAHATSNLAARHALLGFELEPGEDEVLALITPLDESQLGQDLLARFAGRKLFAFDPWDAVRAIFDAAEVDGWLRRRPALGRALLRASSRVHFAPVTTGRLSEDEAWERMLHVALEVPSPVWSLESLLTWALERPHHLASVAADADLLAELRAEARGRVGEAADMLLELLGDPSRLDPARAVLVAGLGARAARAAASDPSLIAVADHAYNDLTAEVGVIGAPRRARFEPIARACGGVYADLVASDSSHVRELRDRLDAALRRVDALPIAPFSRASQTGWHDRLAALGRALADGHPDTLRSELDWVLAHDTASHEPELVRRAHAAARLSYYLSSWPAADASGATTAELARDYIASGSHVDMLRAELASSDVGDALRPHVVDLLDRLTERRASLDRAWAARLTSSLAIDTHVPQTLGVQDVLSRVVAPLARDHRVLVIVLDGASWGVARALQADALASSWTLSLPTDPERPDEPLPVLAALPSVTAFSRTSLLTGELQMGTQFTEKKGFCANSSLASALPKHREVALFHKGELDATGVGGVGEAVHAALTRKEHHVVGVVVNAVDDQLGGAQQLAMRWTLDAISPLRSLLDLARAHSRVVVIASDHGHVVEDRSERAEIPDAVSGRHRPATEPPRPGEVLLSGRMGKTFDPASGKVVLAVDERVRYSARHHGYHGGAAIQEVVAPLIVLTPHDVTLPEGAYVELSDHRPGWWSFSPEALPVDTSAVDPPEPEPEPEPQVDLFSAPSEPIEVAPTRAPDADAASLAKRLLDSSVWAKQLEHHRALQSKPGDVFRLLVALLERDGTATETELSTAITRSGSRTRRLLSAVRTALNVDGYNVLQHDLAEHIVRLDADLLRAQFDLDDEAPS